MIANAPTISSAPRRAASMADIVMEKSASDPTESDSFDLEESNTAMAAPSWTVPLFKREQVDAAGDDLRKEVVRIDELAHALAIINNWRSSHSFPLNTFQTTLRRSAREVALQAKSVYVPTVAQRTKRLTSIDKKLKRFKGLQLSEMQDIGGCRAVMGSVSEVETLVDRYRNSQIRHVLVDEDDYIGSPKNSGYRGVHLIYRYLSDRNPTYNGLKIEMQIRTPYQHAWATTVETVDAFTGQALKSSGGEADWRRFFKLMGTVISQRERTSAVPGTPTGKKELLGELKDLATRLEVRSRLDAYRQTLQAAETGVIDGHLFLLQLDVEKGQLRITGYRSGQMTEASEQYLEVEKGIIDQPGADAVLVSVESLATLRRAYPNYFADTSVFIGIVEEAIR